MLQIIKTFNSRFDAEIAKGLLEANNIQAVINADDEGGLYPFTFIRGVTLSVSEKDGKKAKELIEIYLSN